MPQGNELAYVQNNPLFQQLLQGQAQAGDTYADPFGLERALAEGNGGNVRSNADILYDQAYSAAKNNPDYTGNFIGRDEFLAQLQAAIPQQTQAAPITPSIPNNNKNISIGMNTAPKPQTGIQDPIAVLAKAQIQPKPQQAVQQQQQQQQQPLQVANGAMDMGPVGPNVYPDPVTPQTYENELLQQLHDMAQVKAPSPEGRANMSKLQQFFQQYQPSRLTEPNVRYTEKTDRNIDSRVSP